ncbi:MAG: HpsJ family protein [Fischerella sp. CENA71]|nr:HpsJ family protein [Fischerella sp. CENA71]
MTKSKIEKLNSPQFVLTQESSLTILRSLGYGLLILSLFDWVAMFIPSNFFNPAWEFQTIGAIVERVPVPLIGLALVFYGELHSRNRWEFPILKLLSWLTLLLAALFVLMIPLGVSNTIRLNKENVTQINNISTQQISRAEQLHQKLSQATPEQLDNLLKSRGGSLYGKKPEEVKNELLSQVSRAKAQIKDQAETTQSLRGVTLIKTSTKWILGALVSAFLLFGLWKGTDWARF